MGVIKIKPAGYGNWNWNRVMGDATWPLVVLCGPRVTNHAFNRKRQRDRWLLIVKNHQRCPFGATLSNSLIYSHLSTMNHSSNNNDPPNLNCILPSSLYTNCYTFILAYLYFSFYLKASCESNIQLSANKKNIRTV